MGTHYRKSPLPPVKLEMSDDDDDSFILGISSESEFSDDSSAVEEDVDQLPQLEPKDPRSKAKYNIFSRLLFLWLEPLFWLGCQRELDYSDLYVHPSEADSEKLLRRFSRFWTIELERKRHGGKPRLMVALMKCFRWRLVLQGLSILIETAVLVCQSIMLGLLTDFFSIDEPTSEDTRDAYLYALGLVLMTILVTVMHSHSFLMGQKMSMISRIITTGAIYKKILSLSQVDIAQVSVGHIINLASNDVQRFDPTFPHFPYLWVAPLHLIAFTYLVYQEFGWTVFLASGFLLLQIPLQIGMAKLFVYLRFKSARLTDKRVRIMNEIISGIRVIKMYAWENAFRKVISRLRKNESFIIFKGAIIRACTLANMIVSISIIMWLMMTAYVGSGGEPTTKQVFTTLSLLTSLRLSTYFFVLAILGYSEGQVAISRIQNLLELETDSGSPNKSIEDFSYIQPEDQDFAEVREGIASPQTEETIMNDGELAPNGDDKLSTSTTARVYVETLSASWSYQSDKKVLQNVTFEVSRDVPLLAIVGPVGSGKSTLLQCLLGELKPLNGKVEVKGRLSYVSQEPWMFMGTIRDNITFGLSCDFAWYNKVIEACSLDEDFRQLPYGDQTLVGERGVTLSGGQKARVNLARAVYHDADIYLLDDPLSAVDAAVGAHLFNNCVRGLLADRLVILVTHQLQFALQADKILVIKEGCPEAYGSCEELVSEGVDPNFLLGMVNSEEDNKKDGWASLDGLKLQDNKTPFELMHSTMNASSDDQETTDADDDTPRGNKVFMFPHFSIRTGTPLPGEQTESPIQPPPINHGPQSHVDSSESDVEGTNSSPDFPKFRPGLLSEHGSDKNQNDTISPDFPKFRPGLLSQQNSDKHKSSPDFPKFRPGLLNQYKSDNYTATSPEFPMFRPGVLSEPMSRFDLTQPKAAGTNISPDFPKFRPGLLNSDYPSPPPFRACSPHGMSQQRSSLRSNVHLSPPEYIMPHLKRPVSPLARTSATESRFPHIRSILKPQTGGHLTISQQQNKTVMSPLTLRKKVLQHNADLVLLKSGTTDITGLVEETGNDLHSSATNQDTVTPPVLPSLAYIPVTPPLNQTRLQRENYSSVSPQLNPVPECVEVEITSQPRDITLTPPTPQTTPTEKLHRMSDTKPHTHVHFVGGSTEQLHHEPSTDQVGEQPEDKSQGNDLSSLHSVVTTHETNSGSNNNVMAASPLDNLHQEDQPNLSNTSTTPTSYPNVSRLYKRRKSVTFQQQPVHKSPLGFSHSRKSPLSPTSSRYFKRRRSISTIGHKQQYKLTPSPHLPTHVYQKVSLSPVYLEQSKQPPGLTHQGSTPHLPSFVHGNIPVSPVYYKRRKSVLGLTHHEIDHGGTSSANPRHYKRRKSLSVLTHNEGEPYTGHQKRRKSVSLVTNHGHEHTREQYNMQHQKRRKSISLLPNHEHEHTTPSPVNPRHHNRRKSLSTLVEHEEGNHGTYPTNSSPHKSTSSTTHRKGDNLHGNSRYHKRRRSDSALVHHENGYLKPPSVNLRYYKRRKSAATIAEHHDPVHVSVSNPHLPVHVYRDVSLSPTHTIRFDRHQGSVSQSEHNQQPKSPNPNLPQSVPLSPMNYKRQDPTVSGNRTPTTSLRSPGYFLRKHLLSPFNFRRHNRRKSVLVVNRENRLVPITSPAVNRISLSAYQRSLPTTPLPRRYARRKSLSSVITPRPRRRVANDEQIQMTMEAARFDVVSIYSLPLTPHTIASEKPTIKPIQKQDDVSEEEALPELTGEEKGEGSISMKLYYHFFRAGGNILLLLAIIAAFVLGEAGVVASDWWLSDWADCLSQGGYVNDTARSTCLLNSSQRIGVYTFTTSVAVLLNFARAILFYFICLRASYVLHNRMFSAVMRTFVQFFDNNPAGRVLNRFSKDVSFLDDLLPYIFCEYLLLLLRCAAVIATAMASNPWVAFPAVILIVAFLALRWYYLRTSREVKRLEAVARSPVYSHIAITLHGLPMIRSLGQQQIMLDQFHAYQNQHSQGWYLYLVTVRWFGLRIDLLSSMFLAAVAFFSVPLASQLNAGLVGLGLTYVISLADMLQYTIRLSADVENTMVSAERVIAYGSLEAEAELDGHTPDKKPPPSWPEKGEIAMEDVTFQYSSELPLVLKNLCFTIQPAEKVGVVGRTGAGKSSIISVLYRLAEPRGLIAIDGVDTKAIGLHDLRKKMSIIPQDPVLFSGMMRYNLDPFDEYTDAELWEALEQVQLKPAVQQLEGQLEGEVSEGGSNFSVGQRQLVCLARALLRKNKILVLDEATANVDQRTDDIIQMTIREKFSDCTVIAIAHRLNTIMDADKIMLLKKGRLCEFDTPYNLLQDPTSQFYKMVEKTGSASAEHLRQIALGAHLMKTFGSKSTRVPAPPTCNDDSSERSKITALVERSLLRRDSTTMLSRIEERRPSIISSSSYPCALNEIGTNAGMNANDPNLQNLRLPSEPNISTSTSLRSMFLLDERETDTTPATATGSPYNG